VQVVSENVLLGSSKMLTTSRLELLDVVLGHVDEERQVGRVTPKADYNQPTVLRPAATKEYSP